MVQSQFSLVPLYEVPFSDRRIPPPRPKSTLHKTTGQCSVLRSTYGVLPKSLACTFDQSCMIVNVTV